MINLIVENSTLSQTTGILNRHKHSISLFAFLYDTKTEFETLSVCLTINKPIVGVVVHVARRTVMRTAGCTETVAKQRYTNHGSCM